MAKKVLIVDESVIVREIIRDLILCFLHRDIPELESIEVSSGEEAIEKINNEDDLVAVVVGQTMKGTDGIDVLKYLIEQDRPKISGILIRDDSEMDSYTKNQLIVTKLQGRILVIHRYAPEAANRIIDAVRDAV